MRTKRDTISATELESFLLPDGVTPPEGVTPSYFQHEGSTYACWMQAVTPEQAELWLEHNTHNRTVKEGQVRKAARMLSQEKFLLAPDAVHFNEEGELSNGQHRLLAIVSTRISAPLMILVGGDHRNQEVTDDGVKRTAGDVLTIEGRSYGNSLAAITKLVWSWQRNGGRLVTGGSHVPSNEEISETVRKYPKLVDSVEFAYRVRGNPYVLTPAVCGAFHFLVSTGSLGSRVEEFLSSVERGVDLPSGNPALALRNRVLAERMKSASKGIRKEVLAYWVTNSWNSYSDSKKLYKLPTPRSDKPLKIRGCKFPQVN